MSDKKILTNRFNKNEFRYILSMMPTDPFEAKKKLENYLKKYPKDYSAYPHYASALITTGNCYEAEEVLEYASSTFKKNGNYASEHNRIKNIIINKIRLLSYQEKYEELYQLCCQYHQVLLCMDAGRIIFYAKKKTNQLLIELRDINAYLFRQITEYKEIDFLEHLKKHLYEYNEELEEPNNNIFVKEFKINEVLEEIKKHLPSDKKIFPDFFEDVYLFRYDNCGTENKKPVNYFKVICFHNTKDIITMLPVSECLNIPYIDLNYMNQDTKQEIRNIKVKRLSQIEKFNQRYKQN